MTPPTGGAQGPVSYGAEPTWQLPDAVRRPLLLLPPLLIAVFEVFHPMPDETAQAVMDVTTSRSPISSLGTPRWRWNTRWSSPA
jgi:hypothetical protein